MSRRLLVLVILAGAVGLLVACGSQGTPSPVGTAGLTAGAVQYRMMDVKTSTPQAAPTRQPTAKPAATVRPGLSPTVPPAPSTATPDPRSRVERIELAEARIKLDAGTAILVDVRTAKLYEAAHAAGAISMPAAEMTERYGELPKDKLIILYCA